MTNLFTTLSEASKSAVRGWRVLPDDTQAEERQVTHWFDSYKYRRDDASSYHYLESREESSPLVLTESVSEYSQDSYDDCGVNLHSKAYPKNHDVLDLIQDYDSEAGGNDTPYTPDTYVENQGSIPSLLNQKSASCTTTDLEYPISRIKSETNPQALLLEMMDIVNTSNSHLRRKIEELEKIRKDNLEQMEDLTKKILECCDIDTYCNGDWDAVVHSRR